jgi:S-formylglutathione hydrolase
MKELKSHKTFDGRTQFWEHDSKETKTPMKFSTYIPNGSVNGCVIWLSGLTCTDENFITKAGSQKHLRDNNLMVICPDTSPRGLTLPNEHDTYDFGSGAGFYVDATTDGYKDHYRMYSYINSELYQIVKDKFNITSNISISGHSMGGHGALVIGLRNPEKYSKISAFSPIVNPTNCDWGKKAFEGYLGSDTSTWSAYDASELIASGKSHSQPILIDQGTKDDFLEKQLLTFNIVRAAKGKDIKLNVRMQDGYDHSYYFIASFIEEHIKGFK